MKKKGLVDPHNDDRLVAASSIFYLVEELARRFADFDKRIKALEAKK